MASKRILEKTHEERKDAKDDDADEDSHDDKKPKLTTNEQGSDEMKEESTEDQKEKDYDNEEGKDDPVNEETTEERVRDTVQTARHEWLGQVERRHVRVGDAYQVTSLPTPGEHNEEETNGSNGKKKE